MSLTSRFRAVDLLALAMIVGSAVAIVAPWWAAPASSPRVAPELRSETDDRGGLTALLEHEQWNAYCSSVGLPAAPDLAGMDLLTVTTAHELVRQWEATGDGDVLGRLGQVYLALELNRAALDLFLAASELGSNHDLWRYFAGATCQSLGLSGAAIDLLTTAAQSDAMYPTTQARLATLHLEAGDIPAARVALERYQRLDPGSPLASVLAGRIALAEQNAAEAVTVLQHAVARQPNDFLAHRFLSQALAQMGHLDESRAAAATAERLPQYRGWLMFDPRLMDAHRVASTERWLQNELQVAIDGSQWPQATALAAQFVARRPRDAERYATLAAVYVHAGQSSQALQALDQGLELAPQSTELLRTKAEIAFAQRDWPAAAQAIEALLAVDPTMPRGLDLRGRMRFLAGQHDAAIADLEQALSLNPRSTETRAALVQMLQHVGRRDDALRLVRELLEAEPGNAWALSSMQQLASDDPTP